MNVFIKFSFFGATVTALIALSTGCQLLAPYKGPIAPTPNEWKTSYDAPDAGKLTIPPDWKSDQINQIESHPEIPNTTQPISPAPQPSFSDNDNAPLLGPQSPDFNETRDQFDHWWQVFEDPLLNELEEQALTSSYTLWAALERVIQARSLAAEHFSPLLPHLNFSPSFNRSGSLVQNPFPNGLLGGTTKTKSPTKLSSLDKLAALASTLNTTASSQTKIPADFRFTQTQYLFPLNLTYEIDLWCQLHNQFYASVNNAQATYQAYLGVLLSLTADVAISYFQVRGLDAQLKVVEGNIRVRQKAADLAQLRYNAGIIVYLDVSRAKVELARAQSDRDDAKRLRGLQENLLATLIGTPPSIFSVAENPLTIPPPVIPTGIPSELLSRRPDIAEAERNLAASYREIGVAYANFFPSLNLNSALGFQSPFAHELFSWRSRLWQVAMQCVQTVFDAGYNEANYQNAQSIFRESLANYEETVLEAFKDVENALVDLRGYADRALDLAVAVKYARITLELAQMRYDRGLTYYLDVVDAERQLLETEQNAVIVLGERYVSTVMLIRALGGGW